MSPCICEWPLDCDGSGTLECDHCGGDFCICLCGGEATCNGCQNCASDDDYYDPLDTEKEGALEP